MATRAAKGCMICSKKVKTTSQYLLRAKEEFGRTYCKDCCYQVFITQSDAKSQFLVTDKQLGTLRFVKKDVPKMRYRYSSGYCCLYLKASVKAKRWGSTRRLDEEKTKRANKSVKIRK